MRCELEKQFISQNVRGLCADKEEKFLDFMRINNIFVCGFKKHGVLDATSLKTMVLSS